MLGDVDSRIQVEGWSKMKVAAQYRAEDEKEWSLLGVMTNSFV